MNIIVDTVHTYLPVRRKSTASGWVSFNAVCCQHNGNSIDKRQRGGIHFGTGETVSYHCFNCGFKTSWQPGRPLSSKFKKFLRWLNVPDDTINKCALESLKFKDDVESIQQSIRPTFFDKVLPLGSAPISEWIESPPDDIVPVLEYLHNRGFFIDDYPWYWSDEDGFKNRIIIPFYYESRLVGYTARLIRDGKPKYLSEQQPGYVFNLDRQTNREFMIVCEGPIDAISVDGVAVMSNEVSPQQRFLIDRRGPRPVVVPDRDQAGMTLVKQAIEYNWSVSFPEWPDNDVKDINDALRRYGKLFVMYQIASNIQDTALKIELIAKRWFK